jgi:hypothetical protein
VLLPPPSRRPNPNGLPQPIRVRVRGGAAFGAAASPGRRSPWPPDLGGVLPPYILYPLLINTSIPFFPNSSTLKDVGELGGRRDVEDANISDVDALVGDEINLNMLGALMLDEVGGDVDRVDVAVDQGGLR